MLRRLTAAHVDVVAVEGDVELAERDVPAAELGDPTAQALRERHAARVDPDERNAVELRIAFDDLVRDPRQGPVDVLAVEQDLFALRVHHGHARAGRSRAGRVIRNSFPASRDRVKGVLGRAGAYRVQRTAHKLPTVKQEALERLADLAVGFSANIQPGQIVSVEAESGMEPIVRAVAERAYGRGAKFVDPVYFDPWVKRARIERAPEETLDFVPDWYGKRMLSLGDEHAARIIFVPRVSPGILNGVDPRRAGRDQLPDLRERLVVINKRLVNWSILPYPTPSWARLVHPDLDADAAMTKLTEELLHVCRLDEDDPISAWRKRDETLHAVADRLTERRFDAVRLHGPGTDLTVGLFASSRWEGGSTTTYKSLALK